MDPRFPFWLHLRLGSDSNINKHVDTLKRLLKNDISLADFKSDKSLRTCLHRLTSKNRNLSEFFNDNDGDNADDALDTATTNNTSGHATITNQLSYIRMYMKFMGKAYRLSDEYITQAAARTKYLHQSYVSMSIQDSSNILNAHTTIINALRTRQLCINDRMRRWLLYGNLAECQQSLIQFGCNELQPYIELCMRYMFLPMMSTRLRNVRVVFEKIPDNLMVAFGDDAARILDVSYKPGAKTPVKDCMFLNGDHFTLVTATPSNSNSKEISDTKLVSRDVHPVLSLYIYFFVKYCKGDTKRRRGKNKNLLFSGPDGGMWSKLHPHVKAYAERLSLPLKDMGLYGQTRMYNYTSKVWWLAVRAKGTIDPNRISADAESVSIGFKNENKYYTGLEGLRRVVSANHTIDADLPHKDDDYGEVPQLSGIPESIAPLQMEMIGRHTAVDTTVVNKGDLGGTTAVGKGDSVDSFDNLYSDTMITIRSKKKL
jgi:hypothetical protein